MGNLCFSESYLLGGISCTIHTHLGIINVPKFQQGKKQKKYYSIQIFVILAFMQKACTGQSCSQLHCLPNISARDPIQPYPRRNLKHQILVLVWRWATLWGGQHHGPGGHPQKQQAEKHQAQQLVGEMVVFNQLYILK